MPLIEFSADTGAELAEEPAPAHDQFRLLALHLVVPSLSNPRKSFNEARLGELADSIRASGVHQPILVRPLPAARLQDTFSDRRHGQPLPTHELVAGERRYRACRLAGMATIPALIRPLTDAQALEIQIVENLQRDDLTELEEAEGYQRLCAETGIAKQDIGAKIGRSRSYVYGRMKLLDLCSDAREALRTGAIDASKALLIARIPDERLQLKALAFALEEFIDGGQRNSYRDLLTWVQQNVMLKLAGARFDIEDATLRPAAGACPDCPKRTGANPDLFADIGSPDICTDPRCFHDKEQTHDERQIEQAERAGRKVIRADQAEKLFERHASQRFRGYQELDRFPGQSMSVHGKSLRAVLGKHCPPPVLVLHPENGEMIEVLPTNQVVRIIKEHGLSRAKLAEKKMAAKEQAKPIEEQREYAERWQHRVVDSADAWIKTFEGGIPAELLRALMVYEFHQWDEGPLGPALDLGDEFETEEALQRLRALPDEQIGRVFMRYLLHRQAASYSAFKPDTLAQSGPRAPHLELIHMAGVDIAAIQAGVRREIESEERAVALAAEQKAGAKRKKAPGPEQSKAEPAPTSPPPAATILSPVPAWPYPTKPVAYKAATHASLAIGTAVKIASAGLSGAQHKYAGKTGTIAAQFGPDAWDVSIDKPGRFPRQCAFHTSELTVTGPEPQP